MEKKIQGISPEFIRVSCNSFVSLRDSQGRYALMINKGRLYRGADIVLTPIGGGVELTQEGRASLQTALRLREPVMLEHNNDARFLMEDTALNEEAVLSWFNRGVGIEQSPRREVREELVDEFGILTPDDVKTIVISEDKRTHSHRDATSRRGWNTGTMLIAAEVHDAHITDPRVERKLHDASQMVNAQQLYTLLEEYRGQKSVNQQTLTEVSELIEHNRIPPLIYWATQEEIHALRTTNGIRIGRVCKALLDPTT